ncbi:MAG: NADH-quinone oxidoreductase subunit M [Chloroflexi bacterium]|nr:NADH-quinone oxidoreductase subunit M [Chloroflexota bacterium]
MVALPATAAGIILLIPRERVDLIRLTALAFATAGLIFSVFTFIDYDYNQGGFQFTNSYTWLPGPLDIALSLGIDGISAPMVLLNGIVLFGGVLVSQTVKYRTRDFFVLLFALSAGVYGVFVARDLFFLFFFYELAVLPMYLLIGVWGSSTDFGTFLRTKEYGAMKLILYLVGGSILVWIGILALYVEASNQGAATFSLVGLGQLAESGQFSESFQTWVFPLFMVGFGVLAGLWPFHTWSPDGHVAAPTAVSMLHAGVLMKLGAFGIIRLGMQLLPEGAEFWMPALITLGTVNVVYGAISAMAQTDFKYMVGYSSVSHMGYVLVGLATLNPIGVNGAVLQMFSHGVMTALFFAMVGALYDQAHTRDMSVFGGLAQKMPRFVAFFSIAGLASLGLPGLSGFVAEFNVFVGTFQTYPALGALGILGAAITAIYILRMLSMAFFGPANERWAGLKDMSHLEQAAGALLIAFIVFMGVFPSPFVDRIADSVLRIPGVG